MTKPAIRATFLASLGAGLEYYDFIIYGMMAGHLSQLFFASDEPWIGLLKAFAVFAVGYLIRPFGGIFFGMLGDTFGRKKTFLSVMLLMALSTFSIGLLPTYAQIGPAASCLLVLLRILQGLSFGAELPGAITVVCEYAEKSKHGSYSGFVISSVSLGSMLASFILYLLTQNLAQAQILSWGWRIPFLLGGLLAVVNYFIRRYLQETPEFSRLQENKRQASSQQSSSLPASIKEPLLCLLRSYQREVLLGIGMTGCVAALVIFALYLPTYLGSYYSYPASDIYLAMTWGLLWSALVLPVSGWLADWVGKARVFVGACLAFILCAFPLFKLLPGGGRMPLIAFMLIYQTVIALLTVCYFPLLAALFPTKVRYTGIAACYNITYAMMGAAPILITALIQYTNAPGSGIWFLIVCALISAGSCLLLARRPAEQSKVDI